MTNKTVSFIELSQSEINTVSGGYIEDEALLFISAAFLYTLAPLGPVQVAAITITSAVLLRYVCGEEEARSTVISGAETGLLYYFINQNGMGSFNAAAVKVTSSSIAGVYRCVRKAFA